MKTLLQNVDMVVTCNDKDEVLRGVDIWFEDGVISHIGTHGEIADLSPHQICGLGGDPGARNDMENEARNDVRAFDCSDMILYPGLVNTHHHLYQYFTRNLPGVQRLELFDWLKTLYEIWKNLNADTVYYSALCGMAELMRYGCTTCFDHHYVFPAGAGDLLGAQFAAAEQLGIRLHACRGSMDRSVKDGGLPPDSVVQTVDEILRDSLTAIERYHDPKPFAMRQVAPAPCSPFSVSETLLRESAALARTQGVRLHTHLCETKDEERYVLETTGLRPLAYMERLGWLGADVFYAHGIHFNEAELRQLADTQTGVAHCPCSNMKLSSGVARIPEMLALGVPVGLAVDGSASNDASNLLEEIRTAYLLHRLQWGANAPSGYDLLKMATRGSAALLGRPELGQIGVGFAADVFAIRRSHLDLTAALHDPMNLFGTVGWHRPCDLVFVAGECTVRDGQLMGTDEGKVSVEAQREADRLLDFP
ncbi:MAG: 8-oxoguanine deaminase [Clostridiales bacterium]|nr:8-oxoguanine deaminase [Clostridiales bacterium]